MSQGKKETETTGQSAPSLRILDRRIPALFLERPNKYLGIVDLEGERTEAFIPNPGRMKELMIPGNKVLLRPAAPNPKRRTRFDLIAAQFQKRYVLIDSGVPNKFLKYLLANDLLPEAKGWKLIRPEFKWGNSQFDFLLEKRGKRCLLEAKCCTYVVDGWARFPDAPTLRGTRHVRELIEAKRSGYRSVVLILVQGVGAERFRPNWETDPHFGEAFVDALDAGVEAYARALRFIGKGIQLGLPIPVFKGEAG